MLSSREADEHRCRQGKSPFIFKDNIRRNDEEEDGLTEEWIEEERLSSGSDAFASGDGSGGKLQSTSLEYQSVRIKDAPSSRNSFGDGNTADNMNNGQVPGGDNGINFGDHLDDLFGGNMTRGSSAARRGGQQLTSLFERHPPPSYNEQMFILGDGREGLEDDQGQEEDLATAAENVSFDVSLINDHINNFMDTPYHHESADEVDDDWHNRRNVVSSSSSSKIPVPSHQTSYDSTTRRRLSELVSEVVSVDYIPNKSGAKRFKVSNEELTVEGEEEQQQEQDERKDRLQHHQPPLQEINQAFDQVNNYTIDYPSDIDFLDDIPREIDNLNNTINHSQEPSLSNVTAASHHGALATTSTAVAVNSILVNSDQQRSSISDVKSNKMITIRNLNASSGESHNMSFNNDTKRWEGNEEEGDDLDSLHEDIQASYEASVKNGDSAFDENNNIQNLEQHPIMNVKSSPSNPKVEDFDDSLYLSSHANSSGVVAAAGDSRAMTIRNSPKHMSIPRQTLHLGANNGNSSSSSLTAKHNARPHPSSLPPPPAKFAPNHTENMSSDTPMKSFNMSLLNGLDARFQSLADIDVSIMPNLSPQKSHRRDEVAKERSKLTQPPLLPTMDRASLPSQFSNSTSASGNRLSDTFVKRLVHALKIDEEWRVTQKLDISSQGLNSVAEMQSYLPNLRNLKADSNRLTYLQGIPESLRVLTVSNNRLSNLTSFASLKNLHVLDISRNCISDISALLCLSHLRELKAAYNQILDISILLRGADGEGLDCLQVLDVRGNNVSSVDFSGCKLNYLSHLNLSHNQITTVKHLDQAKSLVEINLDNNMITEIKMSRSSCSLRVIYANNNKLVEMDGRFYGHVELLSLNRNGVERIVNEDGFKRLEYLSICHQSPESVPELRRNLNFGKFANLKQLDWNKFGTVSSLVETRSLKFLDLSCIGLSSLLEFAPHSADIFRNIVQVRLSKNKLKDISPLAGAVNLRLLDVRENRLDNFSSLIRTLRQFPRLEFLDVRYNSLCMNFYQQENAVVSIMEDECDQHSKMFVTGNDRQAGDCNVSSVHWATQDQFFRKSLSDSDFVKRLCYRSSIIHSLKQSIKVLDGLVVEERDRQLSSLHIAKLKKSVRSSGAVFPAVKKSSNVTTSIQLPLQQHRHEDEKENEGVVVPTAASPISSSSSLGYENMDVQSSSHHIMANIMREASSVVQEQQRRTSALAENSLETRLFKNWTPQSYPIERKAQPSNNDGLYFQK